MPINYRLTADDFAYLINHSGARIVCAHSDYLDGVDRVRARLPNVEAFVALEGSRPGWLDYEAMLAEAPEDFARPAIRETDLLTINYTSGTTSKPKGVMITHRNAYMNAVGTLIHHPMTIGGSISLDAADVSCQWMDVRVDCHSSRRVPHLPEKSGAGVSIRKDRARIDQHLCAAPTVLISIANGPEELRRRARRGVRHLTAGAPPAAATIERIEGELGWTVTQVYGLTETSPFITVCEPRPEHERLSCAERPRSRRAREWNW